MTMNINPSDLPLGEAQGQTAPDQVQEPTAVQGAPDSTPVWTRTDPPVLTHTERLETESGQPQSSGVANPTYVALAEIASRTNLCNPRDVETALRESAHLLIESRLGDKRNSEETSAMIETLSEQMIQDPLLRTRFLRILSNIKPS